MTFSQVLLQDWQEGTVLLEVPVDIAKLSLRHLRVAIQNNQVSFPSQVPVFACQSRSDIQWRLVELYFVRNWSCTELGRRYGITMERARQLVSQWVQRAAVLGYLQRIPAGSLLEIEVDPGEGLASHVPEEAIGAALRAGALGHGANV